MDPPMCIERSNEHLYLIDVEFFLLKIQLVDSEFDEVPQQQYQLLQQLWLSNFLLLVL
jgi:hypothetical protein